MLSLFLSSTACSNKAGGNADATVENIKVGLGVTGDRISLGVLTDLTGQFAPLATELTNAEKLY